VQAGDPAPDATCLDASGRPCRLFDVFRGPHFTLLAFGAEQAARVARINFAYASHVRAYSVIQPVEAYLDGVTPPGR
jgi:hypothetical protein